MSYFPNRQPLWFGNSSVAASADTRFLSFGFTIQIAPLVPNATISVPLTGVLRNFRVRHNTAVGNGNPVVYDVVLGGVPQGLGLSLVTGAIGGASNLATIIPVTLGQLLDITATKALGIVNGGIDCTFQCDLFGVS